MKKRIFIIIILLLIVGAGYYWRDSLFTKNDGEQSKNHQINIKTAIDTELINNQNDRVAEIKKASSGSTIHTPYVKLDPFGNAPLSALVIFDSKQPAQVSFVVKGKESRVDIKKTIEDYSTHHELPILGLYANADNTVEVTATTKDGKKTTKTLKIKTGKLPDYTPTISIKKIDKSKMETLDNGLTFAVPSTKYAVGFDENGDIRWYSSRYNSHVFKVLKNGHLLFLSKDKNSGSAYNRLLEMDFTGKIYNAYEISDNTAASQTGDDGEKTVVHHDAIELPSGNLLLTVNDGASKYIEDTMIEIDRQTGEIVKSINMKDILPESFYKDFDGPKREDGKVDWFHQNAIVYDSSDNSIIISSRNQDTVMKLDYKTNKIKWILSDPKGWPKEYQKYLVKGVGDNFKYTAGQHAPIILPESATDHNDDTVDLLLFDNNVVVTRGNADLSKQYSAGSQYRINEKTKTAELVWTYGKERGKSLFSNIIGSDRFMQNTGNRLIDFGWLNSGKDSRIVEVDDSKDANVVFEAAISDFGEGEWVYRAERLSLYPKAWQFSVSDD
ncbi:arylsulfate sulfotransferase [Pullulanibacillus pueri]|uniref:Aryl-sulfate sulfotransferase n=1 Tax=Pullulanibacillus pueri TaxID=1437324 RepID=A0A8J2ZV43_9BACL|nr:aryl-sulfate sulfotransferase [Pullulanibacillus pueri]MBM7682240.1 arylsulfate sulfotransferase [Pullulanibacillus pueri]GGH80573.1 aryl-sulfate sulfotransferase [Pullulanibacillus pueri]